MSLLHNLLPTLGVVFAFGLVIFIHEFGHFFVAKKTGVKVEAFAFGFGKEIFGFQWGETRYSINWIPLGGYVRMAGEQPEDYEGPVLEGKSEEAGSKSAVDKSREFMEQPWYRRIPIVVAGPFMNYVLAFFIFFFMLVLWGQPVQTQIGAVVPGMPAEKAGLQTGDIVVSVQGEHVDDFSQVAEKIHARPSQPTALVIKRKGEEIAFSVIPQPDENRDGKGFIGIQPATSTEERIKVGVFQSVQKAAWQCWNISYFTVYYLAKKIGAREKPDLAGPLGIVHVVAKAAKSGLEDLFYLIALISVAIGLFNLFPIPMLDGGHLLYYVIEGIRGKPLSQKTMGKANAVGLALLASLLIFATLNDVQRLWPSKEKPAATETIQ